MNRTAFIGALTAAAFATAAPAAIHRVEPGGTGDYPTIQSAIDAAASGDTVTLATGIFTGPGNKNLDTAGKAIVITSVEGPDSAVIDCEGDGRGFHIHSGEGPGTVIERIQVRNGNIHEGGAIRIEASSPVISDNIFYQNRADSGGAVLADNAQPMFVRNVFDRNGVNSPYQAAAGRAPQRDRHTADPGARVALPFWPTAAAIFLRGCDVVIVGNRFTRHMIGLGDDAVCVFARQGTLVIGSNSFRNNGGYGQPSSLICAEDCALTITGNTFTANTSDCGCIEAHRCTGVVRANTVQNTGGDLSSAVYLVDSQVDVTFNFIFGNLGPSLQFDNSTTTLTRNIIAETEPSCITQGLGALIGNQSYAAITRNLFYHNYNMNSYGVVWDGFDLLFWGEDGQCPDAVDNIFVSPYPALPVAAHYAASQHATPEPGKASNHNASWERTLAFEPCYKATLWLMNPDFRDAAAYNFFLGASTACEGFGPLPIAAGPSECLTVSAPADTTADPGARHVLSGFEIINISPLDACVTYRLVIDGDGRLDDNGSLSSLAGTTPVLAPGESFSPPAAAVLGPGTTAETTIHYVYAYAPALNMTDTVSTRITFDSPVAVGLADFAAIEAGGGIILEWETSEALNPDGWRVYRSEAARSELLTATPLPGVVRHYRDDSALPDRQYTYILVSMEADVEHEAGRTRVETAPAALSLEQNVPNPFNPVTTIRFSLHRAGRASLSIYAIDGSRVATIIDRPLRAGPHEVTWDGTDGRGRQVASGVYLYRLRTGSKSLIRKMVLLK